jgi:hypothetical protein
MERQNTKPDFEELAEKIESLHPLILSEWEKSVRANLANKKKESFIILIDHMPDILKGLVDTLKSGVKDDMELAKAHGFQRAILTHFNVADVLNEFSLLRETLVFYLYPIGNLECVCFLHWYIDSLTKNSVLEFINILPNDSGRIKAPLANTDRIDQPLS